VNEAGYAYAAVPDLCFPPTVREVAADVLAVAFGVNVVDVAVGTDTPGGWGSVVGGKYGEGILIPAPSKRDQHICGYTTVGTSYVVSQSIQTKHMISTAKTAVRTGHII